MDCETTVTNPIHRSPPRKDVVLSLHNPDYRQTMDRTGIEPVAQRTSRTWLLRRICLYIKITDLDGGQKVGQRPAAPCPKRMTWAGREPPKRDHTNEVDRKGIEPVSMH